MKPSQWPGLVTNASPFAIPATAAVEQVNLSSAVPGQVEVRDGMRQVAVVGGLTGIMDCVPYEVDGKVVLLAMLPTGELVAADSPSYGWQAEVPLDPSLGGTGVVKSSYTQRFVEEETDPFTPPTPSTPQPPGDSCPASADGGASSTTVWAYSADANTCSPTGTDYAIDGGTVSIVASCGSVSTAAFCSGA